MAASARKRKRRLSGKQPEVPIIYSSDEEAPDPEAVRLFESQVESGGYMYENSDDEDDATTTGSGLPAHVSERASDLRGAKFGLPGKVFRKLLKFRVAPLLLNLLYFLHHQPVSDAKDVEFIEFFAGVGVICKSIKDKGMHALGYDIAYEPVLQDCLKPEGFLTMVQWVRRLHPRGACHLATVCSTWVWMCRSSTGRSEEQPLGCPPQSEVVQAANVMVARMALVLLWLQAAGQLWILEQPATSLMALHPRMLWLKEVCGATWRHTFTWMGQYGAGSPKPTRLWGNSPSIYLLSKKLDKNRTWNNANVTERKPDGSVNGLPGLKETQEYPPKYGDAVANVFLAWRAAAVDRELSDAETEPDPVDVWEDADLQSVAAFAQIPHDRLLA